MKTCVRVGMLLSQIFSAPAEEACRSPGKDERSCDNLWGTTMPNFAPGEGLTVLEVSLAIIALALSVWCIYEHRRTTWWRRSQLRAQLEIEGRLAAIVESSEDAIISKTLDSKIVTWNAGAERLYGYKAAEAIGRPIMFLIPEDRRAEEGRIIGQLRLGKRVESFETVRLAKDGRLVEVSVSVSPVRDDCGVVIGAAHVARDIGPRKQAERLQKAKEKVEAESRVKDEFLATVSHDLRTPLTCIRLVTANAKRQQLPADQQHAFEQIEECVDAQSRLIEDILDTTRIIYGKLKIVVEPLSLLQVVDASVRSVEPLAREKNIQLHVSSSAAPDDQLAVFGDVLRLEQVCWNLLSNAIKFSTPGETVEVNVGTDHERNWLEVVDHGQGIDLQELPHVFERLHQASDGCHRADGLGLGLHIVHHIVDLHGGSVTASSDGAGKGARFKVSLPRPEEPVDLSRPTSSGSEV